MITLFEQSSVRCFGATMILSACISCAPTPRAAPPVPVVVGADTVPVPINDLGRRTYRGAQGGLFPGGLNTEPADHAAAGIAHANAVQPLAVNGTTNGAGRYVLMSVGGTDASAAWCSPSSSPPCNGWSFTGRAVSDPAVNHSTLVIVNGAIPGADFHDWISASHSNYNRIRDTRLAPLGLSENQVQAIWITLRDSATNFSIRASQSDAGLQIDHLAGTVRALKSRYPNLQLVFVSSRVYGGYSPNGEVPAYEWGFVVKWVIEMDIDRTRGEAGSTDAGTIRNSAARPWISWGPYPWARGSEARSDGLAWPRGDFDSSGVKLSRSGEARLAGLLVDFFKGSPYTRCWFLLGPVCG